MPTQNNGKLASQTDNVSGEQVVYAYDALNRLASATATSGSWGQSYSYDGFGNLTAQNVTAGSAPAYSAIPDPTTNHVGSVDANGNTLGLVDPDQETQITSAEYDVENRFVGTGASFSYYSGYQYSYAPGNKRVWRGNFGTNGSGAPTITTDEVTFWSVTGQKMASYNIVVTLNAQGVPQSMIFNQTVANYYFGRKLVGHFAGGGYSGISIDRLGSIGKYYPYGQEKPSATTNGTEKFAFYFRDSETGFDYADQRYHNPGTGRFLTPDPYRALSTGAADPATPGSWNKYSYTQGDPINAIDSHGTEQCVDPDGNPCYEDPCDDGDWEDCDCGGPGGGGPPPPPSPPVDPSCTITVATNGTPRDGQNLVGLTAYSPLTNTLGSYSTVGRRGGGAQGYFFAVQIQANLSGDTNPADWTATQTLATSGSISLAGSPVPITGSTPPSPDNPTLGINTSTQGRFDWLDEPGWPSTQHGVKMTNANLTQTFTSTLTNKDGEDCTVSWSTHFVFQNGKLKSFTVTVNP